jgi:hypothetical protein
VEFANTFLLSNKTSFSSLSFIQRKVFNDFPKKQSNFIFFSPFQRCIIEFSNIELTKQGIFLKNGTSAI